MTHAGIFGVALSEPKPTPPPSDFLRFGVFWEWDRNLSRHVPRRWRAGPVGIAAVPAPAPARVDGGVVVAALALGFLLGLGLHVWLTGGAHV